MAIKEYFDEELKEKLFLVTVVRKSNKQPGVEVRRKVFQIRTMADAQRIERKILAEVERELIEKEIKPCKWFDLIEGFEMAVRKESVFAPDLSFHTLTDYLDALNKFTHKWMNMHVDEIRKDVAWSLLEKVEKEISVPRRKKVRSAIDAVFRWGMMSGRIKGIEGIPTAGYRGKRKEEEKLPEILSLEQIRTLLRAAKQSQHPWYPVWALALFTGMRSGELYALRWETVDFEKKLIAIDRGWTSKEGEHGTKARYWRHAPMAPELVTFMKELKLQTGHTDYVLPRFQSWTSGAQALVLRTFCIGIGIPSVKFHTLRACFATQLIKDGIAPAIVMRICGWKELKTMQRYVRLAGIEVEGMTDGLKLLPIDEACGRVLTMFGKE